MSEFSHATDKRAKYKVGHDPVDQIHEYDLDIEKREIYLFGREEYTYGETEASSDPGVDYVLANRFIKNLRILQSLSDEDILIHMKIMGGDCTEGMAMYQAIVACPNPVTILNYAAARSMSSIILQAADYRAMLPHSTFMFHEGDGEMAGTHKQLGTEYEHQNMQKRQMDMVYVERLREAKVFKRKSDRQILNWLKRQMDKKEEVWLSAEQAVEYNFADTIFGGNDEYNWPKLRSGWRGDA